MAESGQQEQQRQQQQQQLIEVKDLEHSSRSKIHVSFLNFSGCDPRHVTSNTFHCTELRSKAKHNPENNLSNLEL